MWSLRSVAVMGMAAALSHGAAGRGVTTIQQGTRVDSFTVLLNTEDSRLHDRLKQVIRDSATFAAMWRKVASPVTEPPVIDFARDEVILVARGTQSSSGFGLDVDRITSDAAGLTVYVTLLSPGGCITEATFIDPVVMVLHRRTTPDRPVRYAEQPKTRYCKQPLDIDDLRGDPIVSAADTDARPRVGSFTVVLNTDDSGLIEPVQQVIRDSATFAAMWPRVAPPSMKLPAINFARDEVILVARGTQYSKGFGLIVDGITYSADGVTVDVTLLSPGEICLEYAERTEPVVMVLHRRATPDRPVRFVEHRKARRPCWPPRN